jgi:two-component system sensor histidine kinase QseC
VALLLAAVGVAWIAVAVVTLADARREIDAVLDAQLEQSSNLVATRARHELDEAAAEGESDDREESHPYAAAVTYQVWDASGRLLAHSAGAPGHPFGALRAGFADVEVDGTRWRAFTRATRAFYVQVAERRDGRDRLTRRFVAQAFWPLLVGLPLFGLLAWAAVSRALRPLAALGAELGRRGATDLGPVGAEDAPEEVVPLVRQLDDLLARIRDRMDDERRFTSDAAHELRTPIAGIRAQAEAALGAAGEERALALGRVVEACDRLSRVVAQLLTLARMDEMPVDPAARCALDDVARRVVADLAPTALDRGIDLGLDAVEGASLAIEPLLAEVLVRNLVDNAVRYGRAGGRIDVRVERGASTVELLVADDGPGLAPADLARLGQPFFRAGQGSGTGTGLGLSIVQRIAQRHGATVRFSAGTPGLVARVSFPA